MSEPITRLIGLFLINDSTAFELLINKYFVNLNNPIGVADYYLFQLLAKRGVSLFDSSSQASFE